MELSYFLSTCGNTEIREEKIMVNFGDGFRNMTYEEINRLYTCHNFHEVLPLIDDHNRTTQNILGLEKKWLTKDCWFHLLTTASRLRVVDFHRWHRRKKHKVTPIELIRRIKI